MKLAARTILKLQEWFLTIVLWTISFIFYVFLAYSIADDFYFSTIDLTIWEFLLLELLAALTLGFFIGSSIFLMQEYVYPKFFRKYGILLSIIIQSFFLLAACLITFGIAIEINKLYYASFKNVIATEPGTKWLVSFILYCLIMHFFIHLLLTFRRRLGKNYFLSLLRGNYMVPVIEYRIFMFLDMYSSTSTAETVGHYNYSLLLQECFNDLSEILVDFDAEVYQYVGDEAVLTWKVTPGFDRLQCIQMYEAFQERLSQKEKIYTNRFSIFPRFKAAVNEGLVTVAEIGQVKTEIAYHGDVLSTASRVQALCNDHSSDFLITDTFFEQLDITLQNSFLAVETKLLRGKKKKVTIYKKFIATQV